MLTVETIVHEEEITEYGRCNMLRTRYPTKIPNQTIGNIGLYYVCYQLSLAKWNVMPTSRNTKGVDILIFSQNASRKISIQVKTLSKRNPVPLGNRVDNLVADFVVVCVVNYPIAPVCYVMTPNEVKELAHRGEKNGKVSYWLQPQVYENDKYKEKWVRIGHPVP
jgi:hypothetical protein